MRSNRKPTSVLVPYVGESEAGAGQPNSPLTHVGPAGTVVRPAGCIDLPEWSCPVRIRGKPRRGRPARQPITAVLVFMGAHLTCAGAGRPYRNATNFRSSKAQRLPSAATARPCRDLRHGKGPRAMPVIRSWARHRRRQETPAQRGRLPGRRGARLYAVADGMGGHAAGEWPSVAAGEKSLRDALAAEKAVLDAFTRHAVARDARERRAGDGAGGPAGVRGRVRPSRSATLASGGWDHAGRAARLRAQRGHLYAGAAGAPACRSFSLSEARQLVSPRTVQPSRSRARRRPDHRPNGVGQPACPPRRLALAIADSPGWMTVPVSDVASSAL